ncbi:MAG: FHA domain-containing protein [Chitinophagaceae bacterium]
MNKAEALEFMALKEPLGEKTLLEKYMERYNYFQMLHANAPSKAVEQIQQQNLQKLNQAKKTLLEEMTVKKQHFSRKESVPAVKPEPEPPKSNLPEVAGWLIVHTENKKTETFDLYEGVNYLGRKKEDEKANYILILDDPFVSRTHAFIKCKKIRGEYQFGLYDGDGNKPSVNGVFLNGNEERINLNCLLKENDTVQIGTTKLVFKIKKDYRSITGELEEILQTDYIKTIDVDK